mgnify:FL=1
MVQALGGGFGGLGLAGLLSRDAGAVSDRPSHFAPRAKRIIHLFMNGGPFQGDLFDPKPLTAKYAGERPDAVDLRTERPTAGLLPSPYKFTNSGESGVPVSELLPRCAQLIDKV